MESEHRPWRRQREGFWRAHHEAWKRSDLNQRQYCEAHGLPRKTFENWRQIFRTEPEPETPRLLYRRSGVSHSLSHSLSHTLSHMSYPSSEAPTVPPAPEGHRRRFSEVDKQRILEEASRPDANLSQISRRYGIARRVLCRWKQETAVTGFVTVEITDTVATFATAAAGEVAR